MKVVFLVFLIFFALSFITRPLTIFFHELGHGLAGLLLTDGKVTLYIGSYGDPSNSFKIEIARLKIYFKSNFFIWRAGLYQCDSKDISINKQILISLMGSLFTLVLGSFSFYIALFYDIHGFLKITALVFLISCCIDFYFNIIPNHVPSKLFDGSLIYNDGKKILLLIKFKRLDFQKGINLYNNREYKKSSIFWLGLIDKGGTDETIIRYALASSYFDNDFENALKVNKVLMDNDFTLVSNDFNISAIIKSNLEHFEEAFMDYQKAIELNPNFPDIFNNRGYTYNLIGEYEKAILDFDKAIELQKDFLYALCNKGYSNIKLGNLEEGFEFIMKAIDLDKENSYAYKNLGVYYLAKGENKVALEHLEKAKKMDNKTHDLEKYIKEAKLNY